MQRPDSRPESSGTPPQLLRKESSGIDLPPQHTRKESNLDMPPQILQRKDSRSSISGSSLIPPPQLVPEPAYIASSAASQIVNSEYVNRGPHWLDDEGKDEALTVTPAALVMVNAFLDQLLFSFLKGARSTSIMALKPAINDILKPRLAKDAIQGADEELQGYLTGGDDEELSDFHNGQELSGERNLYRIFRRTRLRCMVYTRLGDMEEEDEDMYLESEVTQDTDERNRLSNDLGNVSPAAAIFLTSIIEFIGEQALMIAGEAAYHRLGTKKPTAEERRLALEESDIEKLAFNTTLGRLWRSWKNRTRPTSMSSARPTSRDYQGRKLSMSRSEMTSRATSVGEVDESAYVDGIQRHGRSVAEILHEDPANIPLPASRGLPEEPDFGTDTEASDTRGIDQGRRRSMIEYQAAKGFGTYPQIDPSGKTSPEARPGRPEHRRSSSMPINKTSYAPAQSDIPKVPRESHDSVVDGNDQTAAEEDLPNVSNDAQTVSKLAIGNPNVSTMYDGVLGSARDSTIAHTGNTREVSMISNYSNAATDGSYDNDMTPQALNFKKSDKHSLAPTEESHPDSHASTISDEYSFGNGDAPTGIFSPPSAKKENFATDGTFQSRTEPRAPEIENETNGSSKHIANLATVQGDRFRTHDETGKAVKRDFPVLYESPSNQDVIYNPKAPTKNLPDPPVVPTPPKPSFQGVPPLTPLRELRDAAHDTSDEGSSVAASYDHDGPRTEDFPAPQPSKGAGAWKGASYSSMPSAPITEQPSVAANKLVDLRNQPLPVQPGSERAAVQRVSPSGSTRDAVSPFGRTSTSSNKDTRPVTGSSSGAKLHKVVTRESAESSRQAMPRRSSSGQSNILQNGHRAGSGSQSGNKELDFENLIKSDETLQYTLTPQNMREMESPNSPRWSQRADIGEPAAKTRTRSTDQQISPLSGSPKNPKAMNGLRANPATTPNGSSNVMEFGASPHKAVPKVGGPIPKSPGGRQGAPRDATLKSDSSMRDFADFIRSTGPDTDPKNMYNASPTGGDHHSRNASSNSQAANTSKPLPKKITKQVLAVAPTSIENGKPSPQRSSSKLKARDPTIAADNTTADLADFLRSGPPGAQVDASRQPQKQSPVGANGMTNGRMVSTGSFASTQDSFAPSKLTQSSTNSKSGLLENRSGSAINNQQQQRGPHTDSGGPIRKQRRIKDPYSLDSDEEDDFGNPIQPDREEESLSDFLRNYTPPPEAATARNAPAGVGQPPTTVTSGKERKASGPTMRERLARNIAVIPDYRPLPPKAPRKNSIKSAPPTNEKRQPAPPSQNPPSQRQDSNHSTPSPSSQLGRGRPTLVTSTSQASAPQLPPLNPRATSPHLISQNGTKLDTYKPTRPTYAAHIDRARPKPQARDEGGAGINSGGGMGDLAEFLRDTEPPAAAGPSRPVVFGNSAAATSMSPEPKRGGGSGGGGGFGGMFGRKRKI